MVSRKAGRHYRKAKFDGFNPTHSSLPCLNLLFYVRAQGYQYWVIDFSTETPGLPLRSVRL